MRRRIAVPAISSLLVLLIACGPLNAGEDRHTSASAQGAQMQAGQVSSTRAAHGRPTADPEAPVAAQGAVAPPVADQPEASADPVLVQGTATDIGVAASKGPASRAQRPAPGGRSAPQASVSALAPSPEPTSTITPGPATEPGTVPGGTAARGNRLGVAIPAGYLHHGDGDALNERLDEVTALGAHWVRTDANWSWIEPVPGKPDWSELDALLSATRARGMEVLLVVGRMPEWARPAGTTDLHGPSTSAERAAFADFSQRLASRYAGQVGAWEVWNEPNLDQFWAPGPDPADYTAMLSAVYPVLKSADPATPVLVGGTGGAGSGDIDSVTWYRDVYAHGGGAVFDIANMHPYQDWRAAAAGRSDTGEMGRVLQVRQVMADHGDAAKPMWGTEFGAPTSGSTATTEDGQRVVYTDGLKLWLSRESGPLFAYYGRDREAYGASSSRSPYWGLIRADGSRKPAFDAVASWVAAG